MPLADGAEDLSADASEAVDADAGCHDANSSCQLKAGHVKLGLDVGLMGLCYPTWTGWG